MGVHGHLLHLVSRHRAGCLGRLRVTPPRPAAAVWSGVSECRVQLVDRGGQPRLQGLGLPGCGQGIGWRCARWSLVGRSCCDDRRPPAASLTDVLGQVEQGPPRAARDRHVEIGRGGHHCAERGRALVDQSQQVGKLQRRVHADFLPVPPAEGHRVSPGLETTSRTCRGGGPGQVRPLAQVIRSGRRDALGRRVVADHGRGGRYAGPQRVGVALDGVPLEGGDTIG